MDPPNLIRDITEKDTAAAVPAPFDGDFAAPAGFPAPKKRTRVSAFKQQRAGGTSSTTTAAAKAQQTSAPGQDGTGFTPASFEEAERKKIDKENKRRIEAMSPEEIESARQELMSGLTSSLIQRLMRRANLDDESAASIFEPQKENEPVPEIKIEDTSVSGKAKDVVASAAPSKPAAESKKVSFTPVDKKVPKPVDEDRAPSHLPPDLFPISNPPDQGAHFPTPSASADLDPSEPDFLAKLHEKYFPSLPADPSKLAWMAPIPTRDSPADRDSPYYPKQSSIPASALRFDFRGALLPPRLSRAIPVSKGLHHHGQAPEAAGYTVAELAILARSAVPAQRCIAFQTLGRILYRLGKGEWGSSDDGASEENMAVSIWRNVKEGRVIESLMEAASKEDGHRGSRAYATEALWLLEKGGWKETWQGR